MIGKRVYLIRRTSDYYQPPIGTEGTIVSIRLRRLPRVIWDVPPPAGDKSWYVSSECIKEVIQ